MTTDNLGSPRINTDKNGQVTARHDYHSFGEKVTVGRSALLGYAADNIRQQFTGYERDNETVVGGDANSSLDFAQARIYSERYDYHPFGEEATGLANVPRPDKRVCFR